MKVQTASPANAQEPQFKAFLNRVEELGGGNLVRFPHTRAVLLMVFEAVCFAKQQTDPCVLNIFASNDKSGYREKVYRPLFDGTAYETVDFWEDKFIHNGTPLPNSYTLPFASDSFHAVITTKVLLEHVSEPAETLREITRVLKAGGEAFITAPFIMLVHQPPFDFFRYTEYGLRHLFQKAGLDIVYIVPTLSGLMTTMDAFMLFNFFAILPTRLRRRLNALAKRILLPAAGLLDRYIPDQGRFSKHYICRVRKSRNERSGETEARSYRQEWPAV
jgi:SAM-dependent methyltransferase